VQLTSAGAEKWRDAIVAGLVQATGCRAVYERLDSGAGAASSTGIDAHPAPTVRSRGSSRRARSAGKRIPEGPDSADRLLSRFCGTDRLSVGRRACAGRSAPVRIRAALSERECGADETERDEISTK